MVVPFAALHTAVPDRSSLRRAITDQTWTPETSCMASLRADASLSAEEETRTHDLARRLVEQQRAAPTPGLVQTLVREYDLSTPEGLALMELAEALLRIPDPATQDALIRDKLTERNWRGHIARTKTPLVNLSAGGLLFASNLLSLAGKKTVTGQLAARCAEPSLRLMLHQAMRLMGNQFVSGETIEKALKNGQSPKNRHLRYSYDMLGEAAMTAADADRYYRDYEQAIHAVGTAARGKGVYNGAGISVKLSALHPRYSRAQQERVMTELLPRLTNLAALAARYDIGFNIDAEEVDRLELSLDILEALAFDPKLSGWNGLGFVVQAYQKRAPFVLDWVIDLARRSGHRLMVRLVKGAYWDTEIKRAQVDGMPEFPVYTVKTNTDIAYLACARKMLAARDALFPQFATHNARTLASVYTLAGPDSSDNSYEFQCLHGMGEALAAQVTALGRPMRVYAPVGTHETLLAYLVRRLLENGANSSFVNQIQDKNIPVTSLIADPLTLTAPESTAAHVIRPEALFAPSRENSAGLPLWDENALRKLSDDIGSLQPSTGSGNHGVLNPADHRDVVGHIDFATDDQINDAIGKSVTAFGAWGNLSPDQRSENLFRAGDLLEQKHPLLIDLLVREAGKSVPNAVGELREAVDFLRYYAAQIRDGFDNTTHPPLGPVVCISPWNFPLAIFLGQVSAALAAGNTVLAKPAEQTPLVASAAIDILHEAGVPADALQLVIGDGHAGARLVADPRVQTVVFTGSTAVARAIRDQLSGRLTSHGTPVPLIAETGGQNGMMVDSSALAEQVVGDIVASAFDSAGQRCSALRVLCVQEECADRIVTMLRGAMQELRTASPDMLKTDVGPVIDAEAKAGIEAHIARMRSQGFNVFQSELDESCAQGTFVPPTLIEIDAIRTLKNEVFGPVLHVMRYARADRQRVIEELNATGYALTFGIHTRIEGEATDTAKQSHAGNIYINRNIVGAVVGSQPFGGHGLSGTGPKAGGPLYLRRFLAACPPDANWQPVDLSPESRLFRSWQNLSGTPPLLPEMIQILPGPTGEKNVYELSPRGLVLCTGPDKESLVRQIDAALAVGNRVTVPVELAEMLGELPHLLRGAVSVAGSTTKPDVALCAAIPDTLRKLQAYLKEVSGAVISVITPAPDGRYPLEWLVQERSVSTNTTASGGNVALMSQPA
ncbi:bifunctional proline dehydrogenase/L-glutamate gamma-semialdehyde dehydrogenase PutA [Acetobacter conturbans]|uniref:Bifunctional protein PutA n=1 Tax=Acetobacter conturbans TaxID=1737472 RepID=A0ABX0JZH2_9PROT|nr:bifunctional proline dehydrogenase/L-glutamate gamma-semialdehyde dehydrogenase PutA [Acetobacter conturbans]NHN87951.1 bifunctional proline dehydrogenase/L-glutamate gamma-semialdehyde dehydrogenase PutA [Acetobacter conturbans]